MTLEEYQTKYQALIDEYNESWSKTYGSNKPKCQCCQQDLPLSSPENLKTQEAHKKVADQNTEKKRQLFREILNDPQLKDHVCTHMITFLSGKDEQGEYIGHYTIDDLIKEQFPTVVTDSESSQGFCIVPEALIEPLKKFLKPFAEHIDVFPKDEADFAVNWKPYEKTNS